MPPAASVVGADMVANWNVDFQNFEITVKFIAVWRLGLVCTTLIDKQMSDLFLCGKRQNVFPLKYSHFYKVIDLSFNLYQNTI